MRAQTSLPALGIALLLLTGGLVVTVTAAGSALDGAKRPALDRQAAVALSDRLVGADAAVTPRANVLNATAATNLTASDLRERYGLAADAAVRVRIGRQVVAQDGDPDGGVTIKRLVLLSDRQERTLVPSFRWSRRMSLPRRTPTVRLMIQPSANTTVGAVRVDGRVRLRNPGGLRGTFVVPVSTSQTPTLQFEATGSLARGDVRVTYYPRRTEKARLAVTVDG